MDKQKSAAHPPSRFVDGASVVIKDTGQKASVISTYPFDGGPRKVLIDYPYGSNGGRIRHTLTEEELSPC